MQNSSLFSCAVKLAVGATPAAQPGYVVNGSLHDSTTGHVPQLTWHLAPLAAPALQNLSFLDDQEPRSSAETVPVVPALQ